MDERDELSPTLGPEDVPDSALEPTLADETDANDVAATARIGLDPTRADDATLADREEGPTIAASNPMPRRDRRLPEVPGYEVLGELGRGGMGVVYLARALRLNRNCALKMILAGQHADAEATIRFLIEAEATARLRHPNIVQVYHVGEVQGLPFVEMEHLAGGSLEKRLDGTPWAAGRAARLIEETALGVAEAHRRGIVHRDLKPANVLLSGDPDETPKVADFGLAKLLADGGGMTRTESILGSPSYMAPEQAGGKTKEAGPQADVYALGAILYELLTGRPPFKGATLLETLDQVKNAEVVPPSRLVPRLPRDLETIVLVCLRKDPDRRYASAEALADDLRRLRLGEPIAARRSGSLRRGWQWCRRHGAVAALGAACLVLLVALAVGSTVAAFRLRDERNHVIGEQLRVANADRERREALARSLLTARPDAVPVIVEELRPARAVILPILRRAFNDSERDPGRRLRAASALTMLGEDRSAYLIGQIPSAPDAEGRNLVRALSGAGPVVAGLLDAAFRPEDPPETRARFASALLAIGDVRALRTLLAKDADPAGRAAFIHNFPSWRGDIARLAEVLRSDETPDHRGSLLTAVGMIGEEEMTDAERSSLSAIVRDLAREAADGPTHSAALWALRRWRVDPPEISPSRQAEAGRSWFVNRQGVTMVATHAGTSSTTPPTLMLPYFLSSCEITRGEFRRFLDDPEVPADAKPMAVKELWDRLEPGSSPREPASGLSWEDTILYCNWLSRREGRRPCYERSGPNAWACRFDADGYRLPTFSEWDYARRAGSSRTYPVGETLQYMVDYATFAADKPKEAGTLAPNAWGFFDLLGNLWEFTWESEHPSFSPMHPINSGAGSSHWIAGGAFNSGSFDLGQNVGNMVPANDRDQTIRSGRLLGSKGFRVVCIDGDERLRAMLADRGPEAVSRGLRALSASGLIEHDEPSLIIAIKILMDIGDYPGAIAAIERAVRRSPRDAWLRDWLGYVYIEAGRPRDALVPLREAIRLKPGYGQAYYNLTRVFREAGGPEDWESLMREMAGVRSGDPQFAKAEEQTAWQIASGRVAGLISTPELNASVAKLAESALAMAPPGADRGLYRKTFGVALYLRGDWGGAASTLDWARRDLPADVADAEVGFFLAMALARLGQSTRALAFYDRSVAWMDRERPDDPDSRRWRREAEALLDTSKPRPDFRKTLGDLSAIDPLASYGAGVSLVRRRQYALALPLLRRAVALGGEPFRVANRPGDYSLAWALASALYLELGDLEGYRRFRIRMLDTIGTRPESWEFERIAKAGSLTPADSPEQADRLRRIAEEGVRRSVQGDAPMWALLALGLAELRARHPEAALAALENVSKQTNSPHVLVAVGFARAMALQDARSPSAARLRFDATRKLMAERLTSGSPLDWPYDWLICQILRREAEAMIPAMPAELPANVFAS